MSTKRALIIRPSSLGDIVHAMPVVHDLHTHVEGIVVDWVAEESFVELVALNRGVDSVVPIALRRWRRGEAPRSTWREFADFRRQLRARRYDAIIDLQEQVKGALIGLMARGPTYGPDRASIREPIATLGHRRGFPVDAKQHLIDRCRELAGKVFGYVPDGKPHFDLSAAAHAAPAAETPARYAVFLHASSRPDKLWPNSHWRDLIGHFTDAGLTILLPWGDDAERQRAESIADQMDATIVLPRKSLVELSALLAGAEIVCGVDTGLVHLAAALGTPTVALFVATDPLLAGVARASVAARDLGGVGDTPDPATVIAAAGELLRAFPAC